MTKVHDSARQVSYLQQCLSHDKKPLGFLLGAGCPMAVKVGEAKDQPLIPDIAGITAYVRRELSECDVFGPILRLVDKHYSKQGVTSPTIEDILTHVRALRVVAQGPYTTRLADFDTKICDLIQEVVDKSLPDTRTPYHRLASWSEAVARTTPVEVFSTNYDLLMEQAFEDCRKPYFDGFAGARKPYFDIHAMEEDGLPPRWARLWKIHGSINWYQDDHHRVFRSSAAENGVRRVIHPSHLKYEQSRRMPYLAMMDRLRNFLKQPASALILCGYSFRDDHVNEVIVQGLRSTPTAIAFALLYGDLASYPKAILLGGEQTNLLLLARNEAMIGGQVAPWTHDENNWSEGESHHDSGNGTSTTAGGTLTGFPLGDFALFGEFLHGFDANRVVTATGATVAT